MTRAPGYSLEIQPSAVDAHRFKRLAAEGHAALQTSPARASEILVEALGLWRGEALVEFAYERFAQSEISRLDEIRSAALRRVSTRQHASIAVQVRAGERMPSASPSNLISSSQSVIGRSLLPMQCRTRGTSVSLVFGMGTIGQRQIFRRDPDNVAGEPVGCFNTRGHGLRPLLSGPYWLCIARV